MSFQIGMLASFESSWKSHASSEPTRYERKFDDADQTDDVRNESLRMATREGIDVRGVNRLARHYKDTFGKEMPDRKSVV